MNKIRTVIVGVGAALGLLSLGVFQNTNAALVLTLDDGATPHIVVDNSAVGTATAKGPSTLADGGGVGLLAGAVEFSGSIGAFTVQITVGTSKPLTGGKNKAILDLFNVSVTSTAGGELTVMLTDTDFLVGPAPFHAVMTSMLGGTTDGTVELSQFVDPNNMEFGMGGTSISHGTFGPGAFNDSMNTRLTLGAPFSITEMVVVTHTAAGQVSSFDFQSTVMPEPATIGLLGAGLAGLGFLRRRMRKAA